MEFSEQVKASVDIVRVVGEHVRLKRVGSSPRYVGLCPFHSEKSPSFNVHQQHQFYKCFGCGAGGDVYTFVMQREGITFFEALQMLADQHGIPMPKRSERADAESDLRKAVLRMHEMAAQAFRKNLASSSGTEVRAYLERRGITPEIADTFGLGYAEKGQLVRLFIKEGFTPEQIDQSGLVKRRDEGDGYYDRFWNRLMFPIHNEHGKVIGFGGRAVEEGQEPKYLNSPETPIYHKSNVLYNLHRAKDAMREQNRVVMVEGYMDVIAVYSAGVQEVVATSGTALTREQVRAMQRFAQAVTINLDNDKAGQGATERSIDLLLAESMSLRVAELEGGKDPDEFIKANGAEAYQAALGRASDYYNWLVRRVRSQHDLSRQEGRTAAFEFLLPKIRLMQSEVERVAMATQLAGSLGIEPSFVYRYFRRAGRAPMEPSAGALQRPGVDPGLLNEAMLVHAILNAEEVRDQVLGILRQMLPMLERLRMRGVFKALLQLQDEGKPVQFGTLEAVLSEEDKALLHSMLLGEHPFEEMRTIDQVIACIKQLETDRNGAQMQELRERIKEASRQGDHASALRWMEELNRVTRV